MALLSLIFDKPVKASIETTDDGNETIIIPLDASLSESHTRDSQVTRNPIEDGSTVSDHVMLNPIKLTIEGLISDSPVSIIQSAVGTAVSSASQLANSAIGGLGGAVAGNSVGGALGSLAGLLTGTPRDPKDAFNELENIWKKRRPIKIITALKKYENMILTNLNVPRNAQIGKSLRFSATLEEIKIVKSSIITIPSFKVGGNASAQSAAQLGKQATSQAGAATSENANNQTALYSILYG